MLSLEQETSASARLKSLWIPRFRFYTVVALAALALTVPLLVFIHGGVRGDVWWVWKSGQWMFQHHRILMKNPAGWSGAALAGRPWVNLEWGWELLLYILNPHQNPLVFLLILFVFEVLMMAAFFWAQKAVAPRLTPELAMGLYAVYACFIFPFTVKLRAELFSYVAFPVLLGILWRGRQNPRWLWALAPLTLVWASIHGSFLMIVVLSLLETLFSLWRRRWDLARLEAIRGLLLPLAISVLFTPEHWHVLTYSWWLDHNREITNYIQEWQPINFRNPAFAVWPVLVVLSWIWRSRSRAPYPGVLDLWFLGITFAFFDEVRMVTYFGMVFILWWAYGLGQSERYQTWLPTDRGCRPLRWGLGVGLSAALLAGVGVGIVKGREIDQAPVPGAVVSWLHRHPHQVVFEPNAVGGYLIARNVHGVFIDGRADFFLANDHRFQDYVKLVIGTAHPAQVASIFHRNQVDVVIWPYHHIDDNLAWFMARDHWRKVLVKGGWAVFVPPAASRSS